MPNYTYLCKTCQITTELWHPIFNSPAIICALCNTEMFRKPNLAAVTFNGTGWGKDA